ncbi:MAG TPA: hypothetical protein VMM84_11710 [Pyrinomonadaceae bacterium]|nr:hypothetical protein [Pyrinomonadaceae bacterium]
MNYPLNISFKILAIARQLSVTDSTGRLIFYVKQKAFKLKEAVTVFADAEQSQPIFKISADRIIDFSASYHFTDMNDRPLGSVKRQGMRSLWRARYDIMNGDGPPLIIQEANAWTKVLDGLFGEIPIVGMFSGYVFHPAYHVMRPDQKVVMRIEKQPAFFEGRYKIEKLEPLSESEETRVLLALLMMVLLERRRG